MNEKNKHDRRGSRDGGVKNILLKLLKINYCSLSRKRRLGLAEKYDRKLGFGRDVKSFSFHVRDAFRFHVS